MRMLMKCAYQVLSTGPGTAMDRSLLDCDYHKDDSKVIGVAGTSKEAAGRRKLGRQR